MSPKTIADLNALTASLSPADVVKWAISQSEGKAIVTTNFRPYEAIILHLATQAQADIPVLWVDHGSNLPETYVFAEQCREQLGLN
jgi:phosphoadenosine phosphosulfate reductase